MDVLTQKQKREIRTIEEIEEIEIDEVDEYLMNDILSLVADNMRPSDIQ
ncbi:hypothetical protein [Halomonas sp. HL-93]|nr:hypothetical protein [Halomonas sp. HL-93]SBR45148.1 hypothetical protein GA0071314_0095 [Halomonas sp. HL-93]